MDTIYDPNAPGLHFTFTAELYRKEFGKAIYVFATIPPAIAAEIKDFVPPSEAPWGMISVWVQFGTERWKTILYHHKGAIGYDIAFTAKLRKRLHLEPGDSLNLALFVPLGYS